MACFRTQYDAYTEHIPRISRGRRTVLPREIFFPAEVNMLLLSLSGDLVKRHARPCRHPVMPAS